MGNAKRFCTAEKREALCPFEKIKEKMLMEMHICNQGKGDETQK